MPTKQLFLPDYKLHVGGRNAVIHSDPENVTVPLSQTTPVNFSCQGDGIRVLWVIDGTIVYHHLQSNYKKRGIIFYPDDHFEGIITIGINVTTATNNTMLNCFAELNSTTNTTSKTAKLTIAGNDGNNFKFQVMVKIVQPFRSTTCTTSKVSCYECHSH